jgi:hypothetical protein
VALVAVVRLMLLVRQILVVAVALMPLAVQEL